MSMPDRAILFAHSRAIFFARHRAILATSLWLAMTTGASLAETPNLGKPIDEAAIAAWDISILPDGTGLPKGSGTPAQGAAIFAEKCVSCHGDNGKGGAAAALVSDPTHRRHLGGAENHQEFLAVCHHHLRLHPPRHAVPDAALAHRR